MVLYLLIVLVAAILLFSLLRFGAISNHFESVKKNNDEVDKFFKELSKMSISEIARYREENFKSHHHPV